MNSAGLVFSLILFLSGESYVIDHGLTRDDCRAAIAIVRAAGHAATCKLEGVEL